MLTRQPDNGSDGEDKGQPWFVTVALEVKADFTDVAALAFFPP